MIKAIIFDVDNTLIDFVKLKQVSIGEAVDDMIDAGLKMSKNKAIRKVFELYDKYGWEENKIFQKFLTTEFGKVDIRILASGIVAYRRVRSGYLDPYPHVISTLLKLKVMGIKLAIVSDAPRLKAYMRLAALRVTDYFDAIVTLDDTGKTKPNKEPFMAALKVLKIKPEETLMIGDWPARDIVGANRLGMITCLAKYGQRNISKSKLIKADYSINDMEKLLDIVEKVNGRG